MALLAVEGVLPLPDVAIFADTGWEPAAVYEHLDRLAVVLEAAGVVLHRVARGNLRDDMLDPDSRYAAVPYYVLGPCTMCDATGSVDHLKLGVDAHLGIAEHVVARLRRFLRERGLTDADAWTGACPQCDGSGQTEGMGRRQCTSEYKLGPINRKVRELLGAAPPDFRRVAKGRVCEQWIGFSTDEIHRVSDKDGVSYSVKRYPLLDLGMSRKDCERWLAARGWSTTKSACIGCPYHGNRQWRELRDERPDEWADAVDFDERIRQGSRGGTGGQLNGQAFLHRSRVPLAIAPIDRVTANEWHSRQGDVFDAIADQVIEDGDPDGCSPFGCRSGSSIDLEETV